MTDRPETPEDDALRTLWQGQEQESPTMTLHAIRMLVRNDRDHVRNQLLFGLVLIAVEAALFTPMVLKAQNDVIRVGGATILAGLAWMAWRLWTRRARQLPGAEATTGTLIEFQRQALLRRRGGYGWLLVSAAPVIAGVMIAAYGLWITRPNASIRNLLPVLALTALWFVLAWFTQRRAERQLQRQIDDLDQLSRG